MMRDALVGAKLELVAETYHILKLGLKISYDEMRTIFADWNKSELSDAVIAATADALGLRDSDGEPLLDKVLDVPHGADPCAQAASMALGLGLPAAIFAQVASASFLASMKDARIDASTVLGGAKLSPTGERHAMIEEVRKALIAAMILAHAQAFLLARHGLGLTKPGSNLTGIARSWGGDQGSGAFIMQLTVQAFERNPELDCIILDVPVKTLLDHSIPSLRRLSSRCVEGGLPVPALIAALSFFDLYRSMWLPANLVSALRDSFSGSGFERVDRPRGELFHSEWR
jgi:6-phosphogluconate dehydrogenase